MARFTLKRTSRDPSDAIIVTFSGHWLEAIEGGKIGYVFRKMGPTDFDPATMYMYVAAPTSAIVARSRLQQYTYMDMADVVKLSKFGGISEKELMSYAGSYTKLLVMKLKRIEYAQHTITLKELAQKYDYWPSSTFIPLSGAGVETLDRLGRFVAAKNKSMK